MYFYLAPLSPNTATSNISTPKQKGGVMILTCRYVSMYNCSLITSKLVLSYHDLTNEVSLEAARFSTG